MRPGGASSTDRHDVALLSKEGAARQVAHQLRVDRRAGKGDPHLVADRARLLFRDLGLEQGTNDALDPVAALEARRDDLVVG